MSDDLISTMALARALSVEPIARALCPDPEVFAGPFARSKDRWRNAAARAALASPAMEVEPAMHAAATSACC